MTTNINDVSGILAGLKDELGPIDVPKEAELIAAITGLPQKQRLVFVMVHVEHRSIADVAQALKLPQRRVERRLTQALSACRRQLSR